MNLLFLYMIALGFHFALNTLSVVRTISHHCFSWSYKTRCIINTPNFINLSTHHLKKKKTPSKSKKNTSTNQWITGDQLLISTCRAGDIGHPLVLRTVPGVRPTALWPSRPARNRHPWRRSRPRPRRNMPRCLVGSMGGLAQWVVDGWFSWWLVNIMIWWVVEMGRW